MQGVKT